MPANGVVVSHGLDQPPLISNLVARKYFHPSLEAGARVFALS
jgi:hypothetical protein